MQLTYRNYSFPANQVDIDRDITILKSQTGQPFGEHHVWNCRVELIGSGQVSLTAAMNAAGAALGQPYGDLYFKADDGTTVYSMVNALSLSGVRIVRFSIPSNVAAFATMVPINFEAEADFLYPVGIIGAEALILSFHEELRMSGGGPRYGFMECINAAPVKVVQTPQTVLRATQSGSVSGLGDWPTPPGPIFPADLLPDQTEVVYSSPIRNGVGFWEYPVSWKYEFAGVGGLIGRPGRFI